MVTGDWLCNLSQAQRSSQVTEKVMVLIAHELGDLIGIGKVMGFAHSRLQQYQGNCPYSVSNQISRMFSDWRSKMAGAATIEKFVDLMQEAEVDENVVMKVITREYCGGVVNGVLHLH